MLEPLAHPHFAMPRGAHPVSTHSQLQMDTSLAAAVLWVTPLAIGLHLQAHAVLEIKVLRIRKRRWLTWLSWSWECCASSSSAGKQHMLEPLLSTWLCFQHHSSSCQLICFGNERALNCGAVGRTLRGLPNRHGV